MGASESTTKSAATGVAGFAAESFTSSYTEKHTGRQRGNTEKAIRGAISATGTIGTGAVILADAVEVDHYVKMDQISTGRSESLARGSSRNEAEVDGAFNAGLLDGDYATLKAWSKK